jgi:RecA-family ATPase
VVVWGPPKCGKTFWVYDLKMHISRGLEYRGKDVVQGAVVYCMFEGQGGADTRAAAYRQEILRGEEPGQFYDVTLPLDLIKDHPALTMPIKRRLGEVKPVAITLDTLNRSLFGSESSDEDMAAYIRAAGAIIEAFDCAVIVIHHCGHNAERPRGHSALLGAEDAEIMVKRLADDKAIAAEVIRMKDGPEGER